MVQTWGLESPRHLRAGQWDLFPRAGPALEIHFSPLGLRVNVRFPLIFLYNNFPSRLLAALPHSFFFFPRNSGREKEFSKKTRVSYCHKTSFSLDEYFLCTLSRATEKTRGQLKKKTRPSDIVQKQKENSENIDYNISWI